LLILKFVTPRYVSGVIKMSSWSEISAHGLACFISAIPMGVVFVLIMASGVDTMLYKFTWYERITGGAGSKLLDNNDAIGQLGIILGIANIVIPIIVVCSYLMYVDMPFLELLKK